METSLEVSLWVSFIMSQINKINSKKSLEDGIFKIIEAANFLCQPKMTIQKLDSVV